MKHKDVDSFRHLYQSAREMHDAKDMPRLSELRAELHALYAHAKERESYLAQDLEEAES